MLAVHKQPQQFSLHTQISHRRHPSAPPASLVPPQRTPGLITLSKPLPKQQQQPQKRATPKPKQPTKRSAATATEAATAATPLPLKRAVETPDKKQSSEKRGRQSKPKDASKSTARSSSHSSVRGGRRNNARQASPPLLASSQAEVSPPILKVNLFDPANDPFADSFSRSSEPVRPAPTLATKPSGKLARRRHPNTHSANSTPASTPPRAIPVPKRSNSSSPLMSRSEPVKRFHRRNATESSDVFPICDDLDEDDDLNVTFPHTPSRPPRYAKTYDDGPRTAPITSSSAAFPFMATSSPTPAAGRPRRHRRVPSEGVFAMSSDEESTSSQASSADAAAELKALFGMLGARRTTTSFPGSEKEREAAAAAAAEIKFANSSFQNSPSPEELPAPEFM